MISQIAAAATQQAASTREVNLSMESMAAMVRESSGAAQDSAEACNGLSKLATDLQQLVGRFKTRARQGRETPEPRRRAA